MTHPTHTLVACCVALLASTLAGCDDSPPSDVALVSSSPATPNRSRESNAGEIVVMLADRQAYDDVVAKHRGKVVLVDFWATWCPQCMEQFPHTVELGKSADPADLAVVSVSMDEPEDQDVVLEFLQGKQATFDNLLSKYGVGVEGFDAFQIDESGLPHYKLYDRQGNLRFAFHDDKELDERLQLLLGEDGGTQ